MSDFVTDAQSTNIPTYADETTGDGLLRMQWRNGEPKLKTAGRFFVDKERLGDRAIAEPWTEATEVFESGAEVEAYIAPRLRVAIIGVRQQPFSWEGPQDSRRKVWHEKWIEGGSMQVEALCFVQGLADHTAVDPVVWTSSTIKTSFAIIGSKAPSINVTLRALLKAAKVFSGKDMPLWSFWLPIAGQVDAKGKPDYVPTKGKAVTPPYAFVPTGELTRDHLNKLYVGRELLEHGANLRAVWAEWLKERRYNDDTPNSAQASAANAAPGGRNVPQPIEETGDDHGLPF